jgi:hypothetical protein
MLRDILVLADRQDTSCGYHSAFPDDHCPVMQRGIFEEDILNQSRRHLCIQPLTRIHYLFEVSFSGQHNECTGLGGRHMTACLRDLQNLLA